MMNLELLCRATEFSGDKSFYDMAISHADKTMANHFRPDYSCYHVVNYDTISGNALQKCTWQGYADESVWSRGQSWALYGYTMMYRETKQPRYLEQARHIARFLINHPKMPQDKIPYWDFDDPGRSECLERCFGCCYHGVCLVGVVGLCGQSNRARLYRCC